MTSRGFLSDLKVMAVFSFPNSIRRQVVRYHGVILRYLTAAILDVFSVGIVAFIYNIFDLISSVCTTGQKVFITSLAKAKNKKSFFERLKKIIANFNFIMIIIGLAIILGAPYIVYIIGGSEFSVATKLVKDFVFAQYFVQLLYVIGTFLVYYNLNYTYLFIEVSKTVLIIITSYFIIAHSQTIDYIPWIDASFIFLELIVISSIILYSLRIKISTRVIQFFLANIAILFFYLVITSALEQHIFFSNFLSFGSIVTRGILFTIGACITYLIHKPVEGFVISNEGIKINIK